MCIYIISIIYILLFRSIASVLLDGRPLAPHVTSQDFWVQVLAMSSIQAERCILLPFVNDRSLFLDCKEKDLTSHNMRPHVNRVMMPKISSLKGLKVWEGQGQKRHRTKGVENQLWHAALIVNSELAARPNEPAMVLMSQTCFKGSLSITWRSCAPGKSARKHHFLQSWFLKYTYVLVCVRVRIDACTNTMRTSVKELFYITVITKNLVPQNLGRLICSITREFRTF